VEEPEVVEEPEIPISDLQEFEIVAIQDLLEVENLE